MARGECLTCGKPTKIRSVCNVYCSPDCHANKDAVLGQRVRPTAGNIGAATELFVAAKLIMEGWSVFRSMHPNATVDLVACKPGITEFIECRSGLIINDRASFSAELRPGFPRPTQVAVCVPAENYVEFINVENYCENDPIDWPKSIVPTDAEKR